MKTFYSILFLLIITLPATAQTHRDIPEVEALLQKMTLEEKIGQLNLLTPGGGIATGAVVSKNVEEKIKAGEVGGVFGVTGPEKIRIAQDFAVKSTRLGIPLIIGADIIHGYKTTFPIPLAMSSSWDMEMIEHTARSSLRKPPPMVLTGISLLWWTLQETQDGEELPKAPAKTHF